MKKLFIVTLLFLLSSLSFGQETYKLFLEEGKMWKYHYHNPNGVVYDKSLSIQGDTVISDKNFKRIVDVATGCSEFFMRENDKKVYCKYQNQNEYLVYDFGLNVGDSFNTSGSKATVVAVDTIVVGGRAFRALNVANEEEGIGQNWWVEGVGGMCYLSSSFQFPGNYFTFLQCQLGTDLLFSQKEFGTLGVHNTTVDSIKTSYSTIYTLDGRRLATPPTKGVYIQNGRKVVMK